MNRLIIREHLPLCQLLLSYYFEMFGDVRYTCYFLAWKRCFFSFLCSFRYSSILPLHSVAVYRLIGNLITLLSFHLTVACSMTNEILTIVGSETYSNTYIILYYFKCDSMFRNFRHFFIFNRIRLFLNKCIKFLKYFILFWLFYRMCMKLKLKYEVCNNLIFYQTTTENETPQASVNQQRLKYYYIMILPS